METQLKSLIWLNRSKANAEGKAPIYIRITQNKRKIEIATGLFINPKYWNVKKSEVSLSYKWIFRFKLSHHSGETEPPQKFK